MEKSRWFFLEGVTTGVRMGAKSPVIEPLQDIEVVAADCIVRAIALVRILTPESLTRISEYMHEAARRTSHSTERDMYEVYSLMLDREIDERRKEKKT